MSSSKPGSLFAAEAEAAFDHIDRYFDAEELYGDKGSLVVQKLAARASHHAMPYGLSLQAALLGCSNGAAVQAFPGKASPLSLLILNINKAQTRKSQLNGCVEAVIAEINAQCQRRAEAQATVQGIAPVALKSVELTAFTEAALFERTAVDWDQCKEPKAEGLKGRLHFSSILNLVEAYRFLRMLGLASSGLKEEILSDGSSELNLLLQTGRTGLQLKTGTSHGAAPGQVNVCCVGNAHFSGFLPILRGDVGTHHPATLERIVVCTGRPCEPHSPLPAALLQHLGPGFEAWQWVPLLPQTLPLLGLTEEALQHEYADQSFPKAVEDEVDGELADVSSEKFLPDECGYRVHLADGTESRLRFRIVEDCASKPRLLCSVQLFHRSWRCCIDIFLV